MGSKANPQTANRELTVATAFSSSGTAALRSPPSMSSPKVTAMQEQPKSLDKAEVSRKLKEVRFL
jgi:hypothetical protein